MTYPKLRSRVSCKYGAPLGRHNTNNITNAEAASVHHVPLNAGGYDAGGVYWGHGQRLYRAVWDDGKSECFVRAKSRDEAIALFELEPHQLLRGASRKSEYHIMGNYGYGWDSEYSSEDFADVKARLKEYQANGGGSYRLKTVKV